MQETKKSTQLLDRCIGATCMATVWCLVDLPDSMALKYDYVACWEVPRYPQCSYLWYQGLECGESRGREYDMMW